MSVTLSQLRMLVAVAEYEGFVAAADELGVTQSAVSHAIAGLEGELGGRLVVRKPSFSLTALGTQILDHARSAIASVDAITDTAAVVRGELNGTVRLAVTSTVCFGLLPQLTALWGRQHPRIRVQYFEGDDPELEAWLNEGIVDAAILISPAHTHPAAVEVGKDRYGAVLRKDHPLANQHSLAIEELLDDPVHVSAGVCGAFVTSMLAKHQPDFQPQQRMHDNATLLNLVSAGLGVTVFPSVGEGMLPADTVMIPLQPLIQRRLVFSGPTTRPWSPLVEALKSCLE